jgi:hypothetical protein
VWEFRKAPELGLEFRKVPVRVPDSVPVRVPDSVPVLEFRKVPVHVQDSGPVWEF